MLAPAVVLVGMFTVVVTATGLMADESSLGQGLHTFPLLGRISRFILEISSDQHVLDLIPSRFRC